MDVGNLLLVLLGAGDAGAIDSSPPARPVYPECPPPFERRSSASEDVIMGAGQGGYVVDACGGFDNGGRVRDGWEVTHYGDGRRREEHWARGKGNGPIRVVFPEGDWWIGNQVDGELEGRREYWHKNGGKWQEATMHRGHVDGSGRSWYPDGSLESIWREQDGKTLVHLSWDRDGKLEKKIGDPALLTKGRTLEQLRKENARPGYHRPRQPPPPSGLLGSKTNPIRCQGADGERDYLKHLKCGDGASPRFRRAGSAGVGPYGNIMDDYQVSCGSATQSIFFDMYHPGHRETAPVAGFTLAP
jgi:hypothetical protein